MPLPKEQKVVGQKNYRHGYKIDQQLAHQPKVRHYTVTVGFEWVVFQFSHLPLVAALVLAVLLPLIELFIDLFFAFSFECANEVCRRVRASILLIQVVNNVLQIQIRYPYERFLLARYLNLLCY